MTSRRCSRLVAALLLAAAVGCTTSPVGETSAARLAGARDSRAGSLEARRTPATRDLGRDEARGGHTLSRHVGLTDEDLRARLAREPGIAAASTYADRGVAERTVGVALADKMPQIERWARRTGRRPNLALDVPGVADRPIGRSLRRDERRVRQCYDAVVVLKWDDRRGDFFVLTSYPEARR